MKKHILDTSISFNKTRNKKARGAAYRTNLTKKRVMCRAGLYIKQSTSNLILKGYTETKLNSIYDFNLILKLKCFYLNLHVL